MPILTDREERVAHAEKASAWRFWSNIGGLMLLGAVLLAILAIVLLARALYLPGSALLTVAATLFFMSRQSIEKSSHTPREHEPRPRGAH